MINTHAPSGLRYDHNADFSGTVTVEIPVQPDEDWTGDGDRTTATEPYAQAFTQRRVVQVEIPFADIRHLALAHLRRRAILALEQADDDTLEKFFSGWNQQGES
jgi:hypothetical protein